MITRTDELNIEFGLHVTFDGKGYRLMMPNSQQEYPIGGLICEFCRLSPTTLKQYIMACDGLNEAATTDNFVKTFMQLQEKMTVGMFPVIGAMVSVEFMNTSQDWFDAVRTDRIQEFLSKLSTDTYDSIKDFILEDTGITEFGGDTVLQLLLTCYFAFASTYVIVKHVFTQIMESDEIQDENHQRSIELLYAMYGTYMDAQHIDYRLILTEKGFESLYTFETTISMMLFEIAQCINTDANIVKCKNCGHYFVPEGRSDSVYCSYPLDDNKEKSCKDVGAQITRANKEKTDILTREYRKVYMRYKMSMSRRPDDPALEEKFHRLTNEFKMRRAEIMSGESTTEEVLEWLSEEF